MMEQTSMKESQSESKNIRDDILIARNSIILKINAVVSICTLILVIALSSVIIFLLLKQNRNCVVTSISVNGRDSQSDMLKNPEVAVQQNKTPAFPEKLTIISRQEWLASPPTSDQEFIASSVPYVIIHHTKTANCSFRAQCTIAIREIQNFHMETKNWFDIAYNFLIGGDGEVYEGRGWATRGAHTQYYNVKSVGIAFIGDFEKIKPPITQIRACKLLIKKGVELGHIKKDYKLLAARQLQTTTSPGTTLYEELKKWDNWSPSP